MKKIIFLMVSLLVVTGCSASYTVEIGDKTLEQLEVIPNKSIETENLYFQSFDNTDKVNNFSSNNNQYYYDLKKDDSQAKLEFEYQEIIGLNLSKILNECFDSKSIVNNENEIIVNLSYFSCRSYNYLDVEDLSINVKTKDEYSIVESNATSYNASFATWNYNEDFDKIYLKLKREEIKKEENINQTQPESNEKEKDKKSKDTSSIYIAIIGFISFLITIILVLFYSKKKQ